MRNDRYESLDGIKGFALIGIIWYHLSQRSLPGGFIGVDVFFTVSGFLLALSVLVRSTVPADCVLAILSAQVVSTVAGDGVHDRRLGVARPVRQPWTFWWVCRAKASPR